MFSCFNGVMSNRNYHIVPGNYENVKCLENVGVICGYDVNNYLNAAHFKTSI